MTAAAQALAAESSGRVLILDDDEAVLGLLARILGRAGFEVTALPSAAEALAALAREGGGFDLVITDLHMPGMSGLDLLAEVRRSWPDLPVVVLSGDSSVASAVEATRRGAYDYLLKPFENRHEVVLTATRAVEWRRLSARNRELEREALRRPSGSFEGIIGTTRVMRELFQLVESVAATDATALILGESGTGKELLARALHRRSARRQQPFLAVNCAALTDTLLESELFGHARGAFSGATSSRRGLFEEASGGTLFLDEIGEISPALQVRLLRVLQEGEIKAIGSSEVRKVDVRVVAATNRDLAAAVRARSFRGDLFYRLNVIAIELPPLRDRAEDIPLLAAELLRRACDRFGRRIERIRPETLELLQRHRWPGNVRELENVIQRAVALCAGDVLEPQHLPPSLRASADAGAAPDEARLPLPRAKEAAIAAFEIGYVSDLLNRVHGNLTEAARRAGVDKTNLRRLLRRHGIEIATFRH